ncbi:hypothetical protein J8281_12710 [Aquimarina sp. U1-2]|uniref:hypothetical protein n=1 Tax=Aquimarina sp. U1-2 TaxID=2823141 RepID=UPI001AECB30C|nr:hypothetical protein [Aquimarina sp. U1-2]MBP2833050.1 hypothetical protein [Aquimarina sp. U1-2]
MKVYGKCKNCETENKYSTNANTRVEFAMQDGETKTLNCKDCGTDTKYHVDQLYAKQSKVAQLIAGLILFIGTPLMFFGINPIFTGSRNHYVIYIIGGFLLVPIFAYAVINKQDQTRVSDFNRRTLKGRVHNVT